MLQQTRVETVIPYYLRWMEQFPTLGALAEADLEHVLRCWEGLGYYSRARKIHQCAQELMGKYNGIFPKTVEGLRKLPGIGEYTSAAIASFSFGQNTLPVDGNLSRVLARFAGIDLLLGGKDFLNSVRQIGLSLLPPGRSSDFNQALMDLGSSICLPSSPKCGECPLGESCASREDPESRPRRIPKAAIPTRHKQACVMLDQGKALIARRPQHGLLGGLWEFPAVECQPEEVEIFLAGLAIKYNINSAPIEVIGTIKHTYSHFKVIETVWVCSVLPVVVSDAIIWVAMEDLHRYPMGKVDRSIAKLLLERF